jgi:hypothetical protein
VKIAAFANCVAMDFPWLERGTTGARSVGGVHTEGIIRLLSGDTIQLRKPFMDKIKKYEQETLKQKDQNPEVYDFKPLHPEDIDVFIWSPHSDAVTNRSMGVCTDGTAYPAVHRAAGKAIPLGGLQSIHILRALWMHMDELLQPCCKKILITYPPDHMNKRQARVFKDRVLEINMACRDLMYNMGWEVFEPDPEIDPGANWCHYSKASRLKLQKQIENYIFGEDT